MKTKIAFMAGCFLSTLSCASAMELNTEKYQPVYATDTPFEAYQTPESGFYFGLDYAAKLSAQTKDNIQIVFPNKQQWNIALDKPKTLAGGIELGYQQSKIKNPALKFLQIKRFSYGLEISKTKLTATGVNVPPNGLGYRMGMQYNTQNALFNVKVNVFKIWRFSPYLLAGAGVSKSEFTYNLATKYNNYDMDAVKKTSFAYQLGAGVDLFAFRHWNVSTGYQYFNAGTLTGKTTGQATVTTAPVFSTKNSQWVVGLRYNF